MPISSYRAAACRPTASTGLPAGPASFSPSRCSHVCSAVCSWKGSRAAYQAGRLEFFADQAGLAEPARFKAYVAALRKLEWVVYAKRPFGGPGAVLAYLSGYTHRIAISNSRLVAFDGERVTFKWKDYRAKAEARYKLMTLDVDEFIRRFLIHVLPDGFHRIRHYGLFANA